MLNTTPHKTPWLSKLLSGGILVFGISSAAVVLLGGKSTPSIDSSKNGRIAPEAQAKTINPVTLVPSLVSTTATSPQPVLKAGVRESIPPVTQSTTNKQGKVAVTPISKREPVPRTIPTVKKSDIEVVETADAEPPFTSKALGTASTFKADKEDKSESGAATFKLKPLNFSLDPPSVVLAAEDKAWIRIDSKNTQIFKKGQAVPGLGTYLGPDKKGAKFDTGVVPVSND